ncbi:cytoplasmic tRNA 2-thiolation protein 1-like [Cucumis melo var. makuwa]|uniref:Cytoplasmic tRNA 2-thiolation protein 1-like n=1 Tax=Cucumis melo var. makuwa TaxID=1194695 RepID=A0A5A7T9N6_CUCMM|nr:cytoplasmic tRNA 2-thiolation protein 1-like [Cucumis melo var. makuwa]
MHIQTLSPVLTLAIASNSVIVLAGGRGWEVQLERRDSGIAYRSGAVNNLQSPFEPLENLTIKFANVGLNSTNLVSLSGILYSLFGSMYIKLMEFFLLKALDRVVALLKVVRLATGHNAIDMVGTILLNILRGDIARLSRCTKLITDEDGPIPRCKPFKYTYGKKIFNTKNAYRQEEIDEIRIEWAAFVSRCWMIVFAVVLYGSVEKCAGILVLDLMHCSAQADSLIKRSQFETKGSRHSVLSLLTDGPYVGNSPQVHRVEKKRKQMADIARVCLEEALRPMEERVDQKRCPLKFEWMTKLPI